MTGSGKTEVYLQTIEDVLSQGKQAMMLDRVFEQESKQQLTEDQYKI